jgi:hypothetical protein
MLGTHRTCLSVKLISSIGSSSNLSGRLCERDSEGSRTGDKAPSSSVHGFSKISSGRGFEGLLGEIGDEIVISVHDGETPVWIVLALFLPNPGDVLEGSKRVKDFTVGTADGRGFMAPVEAFLDMLRNEKPGADNEYSRTEAHVAESSKKLRDKAAKA